ncbi:MAG: GNAT family N-acetyltransferase [Anaerolineae bacterium]|jgi:ribosomal protein S18 acetylase RimI-like enzyme|nr:GNAT family N-acetyltransferase [Anaerolineae bacterium]
MVQTRPATLADLAAIEFLRQERRVLLQQSDHRLTMPLSDPQAALQSAYGCVLVGQSGERVIGYIVGWVDQTPLGPLPSGQGWIAELTLDAHQYHAGLGRILYQAICAWFDQHAIQRRWLQLPRYHAVEQAFWRSLGAQEANELPDPLVNTAALVWMNV